MTDRRGLKVLSQVNSTTILVRHENPTSDLVPWYDHARIVCETTASATAIRSGPAIVWPPSPCSTQSVAAISTEQNLSEGESEIRIEDGVDDGVEEAVDVAKPADDADEQVGVVAAVGTKRSDKRQDEERKPAANERSGDNRQRSRRFALARLLALLSGAALGRKTLRRR